jgi:hypothetical protein
MANRVVDRVAIFVEATLPVSWSSCRIVARATTSSRLLHRAFLVGPKKQFDRDVRRP